VPEGDTIRRLAAKIGRRFAGERCERCVTRDPRLVGVDLAGATLVAADAVGKHLLIRFDNGYTLHSHLRLSGSWTVGPQASEPEWRRRIELWMASGRLTGIDLPVVEVLASAHEDQIVGHLGPDLCGAEQPDLGEVIDRMSRQPEVALAAALLDQRNVAGFGNVYAVEVPFVAGVSPNQQVGTIDGLEALIGLGAAVIRTSAERGPQNTTGRRLNTADHWIYARRGRPCPLCATTLDGYEERASPWGRVSVWCPTCQRVDALRSIDKARLNKLMALHPARRQPSFPRP
jgi:endonuclease VIII